MNNIFLFNNLLKNCNRSVHNTKALNLSEISFDNSINNNNNNNNNSNINNNENQKHYRKRVPTTTESFEENYEELPEKYLKLRKNTLKETNVKGQRDKSGFESLKAKRMGESYSATSDLNIGDSRLSDDSEELENELSCTARSHLDKHIQNIDNDLHKLAKVFREKQLKEKAMQGFKIKARSCTWKKKEIANVIFYFKKKRNKEWMFI